MHVTRWRLEPRLCFGRNGLDLRVAHTLILLDSWPGAWEPMVEDLRVGVDLAELETAGELGNGEVGDETEAETLAVIGVNYTGLKVSCQCLSMFFFMAVIYLTMGCFDGEVTLLL